MILKDTAGLQENTIFKPVQCTRNDSLKNIKADGKRFLVILAHQGKACWKTGRGKVEITSPCLICFDEKEVPKITDKDKFECDTFRFWPEYLDEKLSCEQIHSMQYKQFAKEYAILSFDNYTNKRKRVYKTSAARMDCLKQKLAKLERQLQNEQTPEEAVGKQVVLLEFLLMVESTCRATEFEKETLQNIHFAPALAYLECHFGDDILMEQLMEAGAVSKPSLEKYFKIKMQTTPIAYLWGYRVRAASILLLFTELSVEEIAKCCGFKTIPHFMRKVKELTGFSPAKLRQLLLAKKLTLG